jgi:hypothetical protein
LLQDHAVRSQVCVTPSQTNTTTATCTCCSLGRR